MTGLPHIAHMQDRFASIKENEKQPVYIRFFSYCRTTAKIKILLLLLFYLIHLILLWRNLKNQKRVKLTIGIWVLIVLLFKKNSRVVNKNISLDGEWIARGINKACGAHSAFSGSQSGGPPTLRKAWPFSAFTSGLGYGDLLNVPPAFEIFCIRGLSSCYFWGFPFIWLGGFCPNFSPVPCPSYLGSLSLHFTWEEIPHMSLELTHFKEALSPYLFYSHAPLLTLGLCSVLMIKAVWKVLIRGLADEKNPSRHFASIQLSCIAPWRPGPRRGISLT